jgi:hypothetical protein
MLQGYPMAKIHHLTRKVDNLLCNIAGNAEFSVFSLKPLLIALAALLGCLDRGAEDIPELRDPLARSGLRLPGSLGWSTRCWLILC